MAGLHIAERPRHSTFFHRVWRPTLGPPFASLLGSHKELIVDLAGRCVNRLPILQTLTDHAAV
jgi:hypothetical protein